jgi:hypothetical protein
MASVSRSRYRPRCRLARTLFWLALAGVAGLWVGAVLGRWGAEPDPPPLPAITTTG